MLKAKTIDPPDTEIQSGRRRGWHSKAENKAPHQGKGSATVSPLRDLKEISRIKGVLSENPRDLSIFVIGIHAGLRGSDLLALRWADVADEAGTIKHKITVQEQKTGNTRHIAIHEKARNTLQNWRMNARATAPEDYVWPNPDGGPLTIQRLHQLVNGWCKAAGVIGHFGTHSLRKTYGYHLRRLGYDIELIMKIFGHSSASITLRYIGIEQDEIDDANLKLVL